MRSTTHLAPDEDPLLAPTLTQDDDAAGFDRPWNPNSLVFASFFGGFLGGGALLALNFRRLGRPERFRPCLLVALALGTIQLALIGFLMHSGMGDMDDAGNRRLMRIGGQAVTVAVALWVARLQKRRFRIFEVSGGEAAHALGPGLLAFVANAVLNVAGITFFLAAFAMLDEG